VCILRSAYNRRICHELGIAIFTHAKHRNIIFSFHDSKLAFRHASSSHRADPIAFYFPHGDPSPTRPQPLGNCKRLLVESLRLPRASKSFTRARRWWDRLNDSTLSCREGDGVPPGLVVGDASFDPRHEPRRQHNLLSAGPKELSFVVIFVVSRQRSILC
jgi:hypothetical protein